jgi:hypothetical protein
MATGKLRKAVSGPSAENNYHTEESSFFRKKKKIKDKGFIDPVTHQTFLETSKRKRHSSVHL